MKLAQNPEETTEQIREEKREQLDEQCLRTAELILPVGFSMSAWGELEFISEKQHKSSH